MSNKQGFAKVGRRRVVRRGGEDASDSGLIPELVITNSFFTSTVNPAGQAGPSEQLFRTVNVVAGSSCSLDEADEPTATPSSVISPVEDMPAEFMRGALAVKQDADVAWGFPSSPAHGKQQEEGHEPAGVLGGPVSVKDRLAQRAEGIKRAKAEASALAAEAREAERAGEEQAGGRREEAPAVMSEPLSASAPVSVLTSVSEPEPERRVNTPFAKPRGGARLERERAEAVAPAATSRKNGPALLADTIGTPLPSCPTSPPPETHPI